MKKAKNRLKVLQDLEERRERKLQKEISDFEVKLGKFEEMKKNGFVKYNERQVYEEAKTRRSTNRSKPTLREGSLPKHSRPLHIFKQNQAFVIMNLGNQNNDFRQIGVKNLANKDLMIPTMIKYFLDLKNMVILELKQEFHYP